MTMTMLNVFGGLAIFIFGMKMMSDGLHRAAGERMRSILRFFSSNRFVAILSGTVVTAVIQSSSASTVMVIGFVNAGLLKLTQAIGIIFGANIGTTVTAQLVAFEIAWIIMPSIIIGLLIGFIPKPAFAGWGETIVGLGFLFLGMEFMSRELQQLSGHPAFMAAFQTFDCAPVNGWIPPGALLGAIGIGLGATLIIQSSSACTGIIIALGAGGLINLYTAVALVLGSNIGTTVTAQLAAIPANRVAKQAALAHTLFNVIGVCVIAGTFWFRWGSPDTPIFFQLVNWLSASGDLPRHIANAHTIFNVCTTLILIPFIPLLTKICEFLIPIRTEKVKFQRLEPHLLDTPPLALALTTSMFRKMLKKALKMTDCALKRTSNDDETKQTDNRLKNGQKKLDRWQEEITAYLSQLMQRQLTPGQARQIPLLIHCIQDTERIGAHTEVIRNLTAELFSNEEQKLSENAEQELVVLHEQLTRQTACTLALLEEDAMQKTEELSTLENSIPELAERFEFNHMKRLNQKECIPSTGLIYIELLAEIRKVSKHLTNIAERAAKLEKQPCRKGVHA